MKPTALIVSLIVFALAGLGWAPVRAQNVTPPKPRGGTVCAVDTFLSKVHYLKTPFTPQPPFSQPPQPDPTPLSENIRQDMVAAFAAAPDFFKIQLCDLDGVFIDPAGCTSLDPKTCTLSDVNVLNYSWGLRTNTSPPQRFIATSLGLWRNGHAPLYQDYRTKRLQALLQRAAQTNQNPPVDPNPPRYAAVEPNTIAMSVLSSLAHEFGHVFWFDTFVVDASGRPNPGGSANTSLFCNGGFYPSGSWIYKVDVPPSRWIDFGEQLNAHANNDVDIPSLAAHLGQGNFFNAGDLLHGIYSGRLPNGYSRPDNGAWVSALAAFSPDEDFVETYQFYILKFANPPLRNLQVRVPGTNNRFYLDDIAATWRSKSELVRKLACFGPLPRP